MLIKPETAQGNGSGVILDVDRVVTNCHVADVATVRDSNLQVVTHAGAAPLPASLIARDQEHDLCLLAIDGPTLLPAKAIARIAESPVQAGDPVYAAGAPEGLIDRVTAGIVAKRREQREFPVHMQAWLATNFELCSASELDAAWYIDADAHFTFGSSGGGLFNANGELVGITTFIYVPHKDPNPSFSIRFAIPATHVRTLMAERPDDALRGVIKHFAEARRVQRALTTSGRIGSTDKRVRALLDIAKAQLSAGGTPGAISTLIRAATTARTLEDPRDLASRLEAVAGGLADAREFSHASRIAASIELPKHQSRAYSKMANEQAKQQDFADARRTVSQIRDLSIRAETNDDVIGKEIKSLIAAGSFASARELADQIQNMSDRVFALRRIALAYGKLHRVTAARRLYAEILALAHQIRGPSQRAEALIRIAVDLAKDDNSTNPGSVVDAAIRAAEQIRADAARDEALGNIVDRLSRIPGLTSTQSLVAERIGDSRERDRATKSIVFTLAERGDFDTAQQRAQTIEDRSIRGAAQRQIVQKLLELKAWARAAALANGIADQPSRAKAYYRIVEARAGSGDMAAALRSAELIEDPVTRTSAYAFLTEEALAADRIDPDAVMRLLATTERLARTIDNPNERAHKQFDLASLYVAAYMDQKAEQLVVALASTRHFARGLRHLSDAYADRGDFSRSRDLIKRIPHCAKQEREWAQEHWAKRKKSAAR